MTLSEAKKAGVEETKGNGRDRRRTGAKEGAQEKRDSSNHTVTEIAANTDSGPERTLAV